MEWSWCKRDAWVQIKKDEMPYFDTSIENHSTEQNQNQKRKHKQFWVAKVLHRCGRGRKEPLRFRVRLYEPLDKTNEQWFFASSEERTFNALRVKPIRMGRYSVGIVRV